MATEDVDPRFADLDAWPLSSALEGMWDGQMAAVAAVHAALPAITTAVADAAERLRQGGRLVYVGAGTSGRVAVQDGAELPPTFDWPQSRLVFAMAGGLGALVASVEGAEDDAEDGARQMDLAKIGPGDVVIGVAASGSTPFTVAAINRAGERGALTIGMSNNAGAPLTASARHGIEIITGSELIAGSTRMKAGTAQKVVLNLMSSGIMLRLGRVYRGMMVNMQVSNAKLRRRAEAMVARISGCGQIEAAAALDRTGDNIKLATLVVLGYGLAEAEAILADSGDNLRLALASLPGREST
ncbi:MAG: N-acetylmuramic acid 6-phosphate etherase [Hyphomicrobiales bacterium]|nr:N-acetylmuramic acid 6-phosphate etherase [Hyphomicrobiales bacterium]